MAVFVAGAIVFIMVGPPRMPWRTLPFAASPVGWGQLDLGLWLMLLGGFSFMLWYECAIVALVAVKRCKPLQIRFDRFGLRVCERCGYDLTGVPNDACPECGAAIAPPSWPAALSERDKRRLSLIEAALVSPALIAYAALKFIYFEGDAPLWADGAAVGLAAFWLLMGVRPLMAAAFQRLRAKSKAQRTAAQRAHSAPNAAQPTPAFDPAIEYTGAQPSADERQKDAT